MFTSAAHDVEDKDWWVKEHGLKRERRFIKEVCPFIGLDAIINPEKRWNKYAPDLIVNKALSDLKFSSLPFVKAERLFGIPSRFEMSFNVKDYDRYMEKYPNLIIYFWIGRNEFMAVPPLHATYVASFADIAEYIRSTGFRKHPYRNRVNDQNGNAKESYVLDLRVFECLSRREKE